jgi:hypothetical protein
MPFKLPDIKIMNNVQIGGKGCPNRVLADGGRSRRASKVLSRSFMVVTVRIPFPAMVAFALME